MTVYATSEELTARLSAAYTVPLNADQLLEKASEVIDEATLGRAGGYWDEDADGDLGYRSTLSKATCDQVEFWLEAGEEHDVDGLTGSVVSGRLQLHPTAMRLSTRAKRTLKMGGMLYRGVDIK